MPKLFACQSNWSSMRIEWRVRANCWASGAGPTIFFLFFLRVSRTTTKIHYNTCLFHMFSINKQIAKMLAHPSARINNINASLPFIANRTNERIMWTMARPEYCIQLSMCVCVLIYVHNMNWNPGKCFLLPALLLHILLKCFRQKREMPSFRKPFQLATGPFAFAIGPCNVFNNSTHILSVPKQQQYTFVVALTITMWSSQNIRHKINIHTIQLPNPLECISPGRCKQTIPWHSQSRPPSKSPFQIIFFILCAEYFMQRFDMCSTCDFCHRLHVNTTLKNEKWKMKNRAKINTLVVNCFFFYYFTSVWGKCVYLKFQ